MEIPWNAYIYTYSMEFPCNFYFALIKYLQIFRAILFERLQNIY